jgi:hypothetical protein
MSGNSLHRLVPAHHRIAIAKLIPLMTRIMSRHNMTDRERIIRFDGFTIMEIALILIADSAISLAAKKTEFMVSAPVRGQQRVGPITCKAQGVDRCYAVRIKIPAKFGR